VRHDPWFIRFVYPTRQVFETNREADVAEMQRAIVPSKVNDLVRGATREAHEPAETRVINVSPPFAIASAVVITPLQEAVTDLNPSRQLD
jgi:hypothetical protein